MAKSLTLAYQFTADTGDFKKRVEEARAALAKCGVDAKQAGQVMSGALEKSAQSSQKLSQSLSATQKIMTGFGVGLAFGAASSVFASAQQAAKEYIKTLREIGEVAKRSELDVSQISGLVTAGKMSGVKGGAITSGLDALGAKANKEFREGEGDLTKFLEANNLKLTDREGKLRTSNDLLMDAARLVRDANTEYDKIDIARVFGLTKDWVSLLEKGPESLRQTQAEVMTTGGKLDEELVKKVEKFNEAWDRGWALFVNGGKAAIVDIGSELNKLSDGATRMMAGFMAQYAPLQTTREQYAAILAGTPGGNELKTLELLPAKRSIGAGFYPRLSKTYEPSGNPTKFPKEKEDGGGGGRSGLDGIERYSAQLEKVRDSLKTQVELWGKSNQEQAVALNLIEAELRAKREGRALSEAEKGQVRSITITTESYRQKLKDLRDQQQSVADAARTMGDAISGALEGLIFNGGKASDVMKRLAQTIATSTLRGLLTGEGGFAGLLGTTGKDGKAGGLLGSLFTGLFSGFGGFKAAGGPVTRGRSYVVGENGPELFNPGENGAIIPNGAGVTGSGVPVVNVHNYAAANVQVKQSKGPSGPTIDVMLTELVLRDVNQRGPISQALGARRF